MSVYVFNPNTKTFYRPIDAALRWCNLTRYEAQIVQEDWSRAENLAVPNGPIFTSLSKGF